MKRRGMSLVGLTLILFLLGAASPGRIADQKLDESFEAGEFHKLIVVGITDDLQARKNFENKFVSHLRGRGIGGVTSYSLVPDLTAEEDSEAIVREIHAQGIDGAITVRVVPLLEPLTQEGWIAAWAEAAEADGDLRELIDESLPVTKDWAKRYGVEAALWETKNWKQIWAGRTDPASRKTLRKRSGDFVQSVMDVLTNRTLL
jgi:hypothetical protein